MIFTAFRTLLDFAQIATCQQFHPILFYVYMSYDAEVKHIFPVTMENFDSVSIFSDTRNEVIFDIIQFTQGDSIIEAEM